MKISVSYASETEQVEIPLDVEPNCTVAIAVRRSGILDQFPEIKLGEASVGIYSRVAALDDILQENDRIEVYRPLKIDPKEARLLRAKRAKGS